MSKSNRWVKLAYNLPWGRIEKEYNKRLRNSHLSHFRKIGLEDLPKENYEHF